MLLYKNVFRWFSQLEDTLRLNRKVLRFGTFVDSLRSASKMAISNTHDHTTRVLESLSLLANSVYLFTDHLIILHASRLLEVDKAKWSKISNQFWCLSVLTKLGCDIIQLSKQLMKYSMDIIRGHFQQCLKDVEPVAISMVKNMMNIILPLAALGYIKNKTLVGVCGVGSSYLNLHSMLK